MKGERMKKLNRRSFLKTLLGAAIAGAVLGKGAVEAVADEEPKSPFTDNGFYTRTSDGHQFWVPLWGLSNDAKG